MNTVNQAIQEVPVDWEALEDAFENNAPEVHSYLHIESGEVLRVVDGIADPEMHSRIAGDSGYTRVEPVSSREQYRWMERFITMVKDEEAQRLLGQAIDGKGAFRRFKDVLMTFAEEREHWFTFRSERLRVFMEAWLTAHGLSSKEREATASPAEDEQIEAPGETPLVDQELLNGRKHRGSEMLHKQLDELADTMTGRDLEKVVAFAEFLKARRAARHQSHRADSSHKPSLPETMILNAPEVTPEQMAPALTSSHLLNSTPAPQAKLRSAYESESSGTEDWVPPSQRRALDGR